MTDLERDLIEEATSILKQYPGIIDQSQGIDQSSTYPLKRNKLKIDEESSYNNFYSYIEESVEYYKRRKDQKIHKKLLCYFQKLFKKAFKKWKKFLKDNGENACRRFYKDQLYLDYRNELLYLGIWDDEFVNDPEGVFSPFGPLLKPLRILKGGRKVGILHALQQQSVHLFNGNHLKAQELAVEIYNRFRDFASENKLSNLKTECNYPPIVQLCAGGAAIVLNALPVPAFIVIDKTKAVDFSGFSALPHESGHNIIFNFKRKESLVKEITTYVKTLNIPYRKFWEEWIEECLADAIGVATIKEGEIFSLALLFWNSTTNKIYTNRTGKEVDEHPVAFIRVLLTIEVGRRLGIKKSILDKTKKEWIAHAKKVNNDTNPPHEEIKNPSNNDEIYHMRMFLRGIKKIAEALVDTEYEQLNRKKVRDIFCDFNSEIAKKLRDSIKKKWQRKKNKR